MLRKVLLHFSVLTHEIKYRMYYIIFLLGLTIINMVFFWNETIIFLLSPLEDIMLEVNSEKVHRLLKDHYILNSDSEISLSKTTYCNDIPYFEINVNGFESIDYFFIKIYVITSFLIISPFTMYQVVLFLLPSMNKNTLAYIVHYVLIVYINILVSISYLYLFGVRTVLNFIMTATEEISYYEFEVEFDINTYFNYIFILSLMHSVIGLYIIDRLPTVFLFVLSILIIINYQLILFIYLLFLLFVSYIIIFFFKHITLNQYTNYRGFNR